MWRDPVSRPLRAIRGVSALQILVVVAVLEVAVNRVAVPWLRPARGAPPDWHTAIDYVGLFLFYFAGALAVLVLLERSFRALMVRRGRRDAIAHGALAVVAGVAAIPIGIATAASWTLVLELAFGASVLALVASVFGRGRDLGIQVGLPILAVPLLLHVVGALGGELVWPGRMFDGPGPAIAKAGLVALCLAALATPYCFAPRPFARAVTRPGGLVFAVVVSGVGAMIAWRSYGAISTISSSAFGIELAPDRTDPRLALYLLALATLAWTLGACAFAPSEGRRAVGTGLALIVLGGYRFAWPHHYVLPLVGLALIAEASRRVRDEELAELPFASAAPPIADAVWSSYVGTVVHALRRTWDSVHSLTTRGDGGLASTVFAGEVRGLTVRTRIERIEGSVIALDVVVGREIDEVRGSTLTVWAIPERGLGNNPAGPPAAPILRAGDPPFDARFKLRGSAQALAGLFDDELRARAVTALDGWLAYWEGEGLRYRVYPGRGAPLDHPIPLPELALGKVPPNAERFAAVIALLVEIAARGLPAAEPREPGVLDPDGDALGEGEP